MSLISIKQLFEDKKDKLGLSWVAGKSGANKILTGDEIAKSNQGLISHLNFVNPTWIQVLSNAEIEYLSKLDPVSLEHKLEQLNKRNVVCIIVADNADVPAPISVMAISSHTPILRSTYPSLEVIWVLRAYLARVMALSSSLHGVFLDVLGMGTLITGESGVGKSELALELISRGHGFIADDVVEILRIAPETLEGRCPSMLQDFLEVRGLGVLDVRAIFGETALRRRKILKLIVHLQRFDGADSSLFERLPVRKVYENIMKVDIRKVTIPVAAGRNLSVLVEAAVRNYVLQIRGIDSTRDFIERQKQEMESSDNKLSHDNL